MSERKLPTRRRRFGKGRIIRVSDTVYAELDRDRHGKSWDAFLRRRLGLPDRAGNEQPLVEGVLEVNTGMFLLRINEGKWADLEEAAYRLAHQAARKRQSKRIDPPVRMKEIR